MVHVWHFPEEHKLLNLREHDSNAVQMTQQFF